MSHETPIAAQKAWNTWLPVAALLLTSAAPLFWQNGYAQSVFLGYGDYVSPFSSVQKLQQLLYVYDPLADGGADQSFNQTFIPFYALHVVLEHLTGSSPVATVLILCSLLFASQYGFFRYLAEKLSVSSSRPTIALCISAGVVYGTSTYFIANAYPGHISALVLSAVFPFLVRCFDAYLEVPEYRLPPGATRGLLLSLLLGAAAFANIGNFVSLVLVLGAYATFCCLLNWRETPQIAVKFSYFLVVMLLINAWWMLTYVIDIGAAIRHNEEANTIGAGLHYATRYSTISNIYTGVPEAVFHISGFLPVNLHADWPYRVFIWGLLTIGVAGYVVSYEGKLLARQLVFGALMLFAAFLSKGPNPPFGEAFMYLWDRVPAFQIFRRPASKIYWAYWFGFVALAGMSAHVCIARMRGHRYARLVRGAVLALFLGAAGLSASLLIMTSLLKGVTPPPYYYTASESLQAEKASRILMFPTIENGAPYTLNETLGRYYGIDFFEQMINAAILIPDTADRLGSASVRGRLASIENAFIDGSPLCEALQELGISHVIFRSDVEVSDLIAQRYRTALRNVSLSHDLEAAGTFGTLRVFRVAPNCRQHLLTSVPHSTRTNPDSQTPTKISLQIADATDSVRVVLRNGFNTSWMIDAHEPEASAMLLAWRHARMLVAYLCRCFDPSLDSFANVSHSHYRQFGNQWDIQLRPGKRNVEFAVVYVKQYVFYLGLLISALFSLYLLIGSTEQASLRSLRAP